jgi:hypothetical protein
MAVLSGFLSPALSPNASGERTLSRSIAPFPMDGEAAGDGSLIGADMLLAGRASSQANEPNVTSEPTLSSSNSTQRDPRPTPDLPVL